MTATPYIDPPTVEQLVWCPPGEITLGEAARRLRDAGYEVDVSARILVATRIVEDDCLSLTLALSHESQVVSHWRLLPLTGSARKVRLEEGVRRGDVVIPFTFTRAVRRGVALSRLLDIQRRAAQSPAVIGDEIQAAHQAETAVAGAA